MLYEYYTCMTLPVHLSFPLSLFLALSPILCLYRHIANCSHWVQQDAPEQVNQFMREFLQE